MQPVVTLQLADLGVGHDHRPAALHVRDAGRVRAELPAPVDQGDRGGDVLEGCGFPNKAGLRTSLLVRAATILWRPATRWPSSRR